MTDEIITLDQVMDMCEQVQQSQISLSDIKILRKVQTSDLATIYLAKGVYDNKKYVLKTFPMLSSNSSSKSYKNEKRFANLNHQNIIKMHSAQSRSQITFGRSSTVESCIIMDCAEHGNLHDLIYNSSYRGGEKLARTIFHQIVAGAEYLHSNSIAHMDLKLSNIFVDGNLCMKIGDFDSAVKNGQGYQQNFKGTKEFRAPEQRNGEVRDEYAVDSYALGIILFNLAFQSMPYLEDKKINGLDLSQLMHSNVDAFWQFHQQHNDLPSNISCEFKELFHLLTDQIVLNRITIKQVKQTKWFKGPTYTPKELKKALSFATKI